MLSTHVVQGLSSCIMGVEDDHAGSLQAECVILQVAPRRKDIFHLQWRRVSDDKESCGAHVDLVRE